ncbi:ChaN family lipoprotein [Phaeobacter inhibens]|uniref:ChaN family lipoprotein n=1 Tax=Phaeobacter inhibens TaxID=221822 RepID=UPI0021A3967C|nr:ChaN family lipoprotein [Phaeobacter inhibens]UWR75430.1 ChaN family lipoprotein [Phaeobacter inhibens]
MKNHSDVINKGAPQIGRAFLMRGSALGRLALCAMVLAVAMAGSVAADSNIGHAPSPAVLARSSAEVLPVLAEADVVFLGEVHDNPAHHQVQAELIAHLRPQAVVWEMITMEQSQRLTPALLRDGAALAEILDWAQSGWPDFALYQPVFAASSDAAQFGALVPRADTRRAMEIGVAAFFGVDAARYGLTDPLPEAQQSQREADQLVNHCNAMPPEMLPVLVDLQRLRDAALARAVVIAMQQPDYDRSKGPVVVITGNGHARLDRGAPVALHKARPDLRIAALGQSEDSQIAGVFDVVLDAVAIHRPDPCLAFQ